METTKAVEKKILLSRLLTRSGDQAWSFAVPIVMIQIFSKHSLPAIIYFFVLMLGGVIITPHVGRFIDSMPRFKLIKIGIALQMVCITLALAIVATLERMHAGDISPWDPKVLIPLVLLTLSGLITRAGETIMDITVANDIVPTLIPTERMGIFNSRFRQVDLLTEVTSPLIAGLIMSLAPSAYRLLGFFIIWFWNFASYIPEYRLLKAAFALSPSLREEKAKAPAASEVGLWRKLITGWPEFRRQGIFLAMAAYSLLWLSVLSPHGVLLTAFLKNGWKLPELVIGGFRGLGAVFGLLATLAYPALLKKLGLLKTSKIFLFLQATSVSIALIFFHLNSWIGYIAFLVFVLVSRIGLYGYSLAEGQMRQMYIEDSQRGRVNGTASSLNSLATVALFAFGMVFSDPDQFFVLVYVSVAAVISASLIIVFWKPNIPRIDEPIG